MAYVMTNLTLAESFLWFSILQKMNKRHRSMCLIKFVRFLTGQAVEEEDRDLLLQEQKDDLDSKAVPAPKFKLQSNNN